ncbi:MAG: restriction endonuclease subunit S [Bacteroidales bacterium]|jgi:type I restriction enzyme S subunit|nr:restriction endonuclease subunit S [Bacteroidales bacterium]
MNNNNSTYKDSPLGKIPDDWEVKHFEDVADIDNESLNSLTAKDYEFDYISLSDVDSDVFKIETTKQVFATAPSRARRIAHKGDVLMSTVRPNLQGFSFIRDDVKDLIVSTGFAVITAKKCNNEFLFQYLFSTGISKQFYQLLVGSNYPAINSSDVKKLKLPIPPLPEQKAIAHLLGLMDSAIYTNNQLIAKKELQKKWLMQNLLTGKKRLKEFGGEWKEYILKNCFHFIKSYSISRDGLSREQGKHYCIHYGDIHAYYETDFIDFKTQSGIPRINDNKVNVNTGDYLHDGDIIIADASEDYEGVGEAVEVINIQDKTVVGGLHTIVLRDFSGVTSSLFRAYLFNSERVRNELRKKATGTSVYSVTKTTLESLVFKLPPLNEQRSIAMTLQAADNEILLLKAKTEKLREQKKGLMQVLLTGKKRLKVIL